MVTLALALSLGEEAWQSCRAGHWVSWVQPGIWPANASRYTLVQLATFVGKKQTIWSQLLFLQHPYRCFGNRGISGYFTRAGNCCIFFLWQEAPEQLW